MSPAPTNPLEQVSKVLQPNSNVSIAEKIAVLQAFAATLTGKKWYHIVFWALIFFIENLTFEKSAQILQAAPLGLFYYGFSVENDQLTSVLCELISKILLPFTYDQIVCTENKVYIASAWYM